MAAFLAQNDSRVYFHFKEKVLSGFEIYLGDFNHIMCHTDGYIANKWCFQSWNTQTAIFTVKMYTWQLFYLKTIEITASFVI